MNTPPKGTPTELRLELKRMVNGEQTGTITTLFLTRGEGLEIILEKFGENDNSKLVAIRYKSAPSSIHSTPLQIGPARLKLQRGLSINPQTWRIEDITDFVENYEVYQDIAARKGNGGVFDRGSCEKVYLLDKITNTVAEFGLVLKKDRIYTPEYKKLGIRALNPQYQVSLELTGTLYILTEKNKLRKWRLMGRNDFTRPQLRRRLPGVCEVTRMRTCIRTRKAIMTEEEKSCMFEYR